LSTTPASSGCCGWKEQQGSRPEINSSAEALTRRCTHRGESATPSSIPREQCFALASPVDCKGVSHRAKPFDRSVKVSGHHDAEKAIEGATVCVTRFYFHTLPHSKASSKLLVVSQQFSPRMIVSEGYVRFKLRMHSISSEEAAMDFIERFFGVSPDGGNGVLEVCLFTLLSSLIFAPIWWRHTSRRRAEVRSSSRA
jgi:hypothetical protein